MATGGHCAVPQSALYEHGLLVGVVLGPERASPPCCQASAQGGHSDELDELLWAGDLADGDTEPPGKLPTRHPAVRGRGPATHLAAAATADALTADMLPQWRPASDRPNASPPHSATGSSANKSASGSPPDPAPTRIPDRQHPASHMQRGITVRLSDCSLSGVAESLGPDAGL